MNLLLRRRVDAFFEKLLTKKYKWNAKQPNVICDSLSLENGKNISTNEYILLCINKSRSGDYDSAINGYLNVLECSFFAVGSLSPTVARGLFKCLLASNDYYLAWLLIKNMYESLKLESEPSPELQTTLFYINTDLVRLSDYTQKVVNGYEFDELFELTRDYSGNPNYTFVNDKNDIRKEFILIKNNNK